MVKSQRITKPRKQPLQARSRATVDAIMQASTYILNESGWGGLNTNAIAARAGVNIASLYQFFPNKQAVIAELQRRHAASMHEDVRNAMLLMSQQSTLRAALEIVVDMVVKEHRKAPDVHKAIAEELPLSQCDPDNGNNEMLKNMINALQPFMKNVPDPELATYMVGISIQAIVHQVTNEQPALLDKADFVTELVTLAEGFLVRQGK
ncbi:TetR/AcrR family transcriptional regulator [Methylovorus glucosotrophus]|uniref:Transcriptional regulator, TetR family n=1 Tax=Methylovorus glucosotrophus (strain SIP3-4) TaxID=582744 RepID=C6X7J2_METGS|nr:TetR/AcrR family transcriptional regulator [Methylovorus glucosotrophus]ACT51457.1 transcriptional regulator, TetR family [Methylovorus glucosotrophus SIP3-4]